LTNYGDGLEAGQIVTTGTCVIPVAIAHGDAFRADFGDLGSVQVRLV
jgi:2-keto-4-pentenoate hydratase